MIRQFTYRIEPEYDSFTIREYLSLKGYPNAVFVQLKKTPESVLLNGIWAYMRTKLSAGDELFIRLEESTSSAHILPVSMPLSICYEDEDILAVNKPAQMPVHPSLNHYDHTLAMPYAAITMTRRFHILSAASTALTVTRPDSL